jgi:hypothetical protein
MQTLPAPTSRRCFRLATLLATSLWLTPAMAWDAYGHQIVGAIADQLIAGTPTAAKVRKVLGSNLQTASVWADCARSVESVKGVWSYNNPGAYKACAIFENAASQAALIAFVKRNATRCAPNASYAQCRHKAYHFTDISIQRPDYSPTLPGAGPNDLVQALGATLTVLQGGQSPAPINIVGQREALRLLTHYVGDLHQPLHVGSVYLTDAGKPMDPATQEEAHAHDNAGGNKILLKGWKLHARWDDVPGKTTTKLLGGAGAAQARQVPASTGPIANWPATWASETLVAARSAFKGLDIQPKVGDQWPATAEEPAYRVSRETLHEAQLVKAGARLAQILTTIWP